MREWHASVPVWQFRRLPNELFARSCCPMTFAANSFAATLFSHRRQMRRSFTVVLLALLIGIGSGISAHAQSRSAQNPSVRRALQHAAAVFEDGKHKPQVLLLGVFHFAGEQVDANTTPMNLRVDMLSPERQTQIDRLVKRLAAFKPTRIAVEMPPTSQTQLDSQYNAYRASRTTLGARAQSADERTQLAFRLAEMLHLEKLHAIDAQPFQFALSAADSLTTLEKYKDQSLPGADVWDHRYDVLSAYHDTLKATLPLNDFLSYLNSPETQARSIGRWLVTTKRGTNEEPVGADRFITRYYNRNLRIFSNIQRVVARPDDRVLVIYGATHMYILAHLLAASPELVLKDIQPYLR